MTTTDKATSNAKAIENYGADLNRERKLFRIFFITIACALLVGALVLISAIALDAGAKQQGVSPRVVYDTPSTDDRNQDLINETKKPVDRIPVPNPNTP